MIISCTEREEKEREEREKLEAEKREYEARLAKLEEQAEKQRQREREIEEKEAKRRQEVDKSRSVRGAERGGPTCTVKAACPLIYTPYMNNTRSVGNSLPLVINTECLKRVILIT